MNYVPNQEMCECVRETELISESVNADKATAHACVSETPVLITSTYSLRNAVLSFWQMALTTTIPMILHAPLLWRRVQLEPQITANSEEGEEDVNQRPKLL